uniref:YqaJ viral recombinase family nuclease n=1 Tax=Polynucleobacter sp. TaxID=2029855 RepID=UPI00404730D3
MLNNQDFALLRAKSLGGSDVGAVLGLSKYRSAVDVWMEKTGKEIAVRDSLPLRFGQFAEEFVASEYAMSTGLFLASHDAAVVHPEYQYMHGHIDRFVLDGNLPLIDADGKIAASRILECKTANPFAKSEWGEAGSDQVPLSYLVQCVWYMMLTNIDRTDLAVLFGNADFRIYEITRDLELEQMVLEKAIDFWENHVLKDIPPPAASESDYKTLFGKSTLSKSIEAPAQTYELIKKLKSLNEQVEQYEAEISQIKQSIMGQMQDAEILTFQGQTLVTWKAPKPSLRLDAKKLTAEHPDLVHQYQVPIQNSRRLVIKELS